MDKDHVIELVEENGEVHFVVEEHESVAGDEMIGVRQSSNYKFATSCIVIDEGSNEHHVPYDRIVYAEVPGSFPD